MVSKRILFFSSLASLVISFQNCSSSFESVSSQDQKNSASSIGTLDKPGCQAMSKYAYQDLVDSSEDPSVLLGVVSSVMVLQERTWGRMVGFGEAYGVGRFQAYLDGVGLRNSYNTMLAGQIYESTFVSPNESVDLNALISGSNLTLLAERTWARHTGYSGPFGTGLFQQWLDLQGLRDAYNRMIAGNALSLYGPKEDPAYLSTALGSRTVLDERNWARSAGFQGEFGFGGFQRWIDLNFMREAYLSYMGCQ